MDVRGKIEALADDKMAEYSRRLNPTLSPEVILGIKTPVLRSIAKELAVDSECNEFLCDLPHKYFEENQLHGFVISSIKDFDDCVERLEEFLPYIDNWATCDQTSPRVFKKNKELLIEYIERWLDSNQPYVIRFAVNMLMQNYLDDSFKSEYLDMVASIESEHYYVHMVMAWYFATALAKQYDEAVKIIEEKRLPRWIHNKTIQKANESFRVTEEHKQYLKSLKY